MCAVYPRGDEEHGGAGHLSLYVVGPPNLANRLSPLTAAYRLSVVDRRDASKTVRKEATHAFSATDTSASTTRISRGSCAPMRCCRRTRA